MRLSPNEILFIVQRYRAMADQTTSAAARDVMGQRANELQGEVDRIMKHRKTEIHAAIDEAL